MTRLPFGLCIAPKVFDATLDYVVETEGFLGKVDKYMDDIICPKELAQKLRDSLNK